MADVTSFGVAGDPAFAAPPETHIEITGHRIVYSANGTSDHTVYTIATKTNLLTFNDKQPVVTRRYNDFLALQTRLRSEVSAETARIIPYLPYSWYSVVVRSTRFDDEFIKNRKEELLLFLDGVVNTPQLMYTVSLRQFLESVELDWD